MYITQSNPCNASFQVLGKPEPLLLELLMNASDPPLDPRRTVMVGDRSIISPLLIVFMCFVPEAPKQNGQFLDNFSFCLYLDLSILPDSHPRFLLICGWLQDTDIQFGLAGGLHTLLVSSSDTEF
jgi:ribonucleotide monophosphatase NagD (HAD superfamily)